jgi:phosphatidate cytidylyltransferase
MIGRYCHLAWTHMAILFTTVQAYLVLQTLVYGTAWYIFAMSIITINDIAAYMCGFFVGSRPLILLSPKKTLEGFIGEFLVVLALLSIFLKLSIKNYVF